MKKPTFLLTFFLIFSCFHNSFADSFILNISYTEGEKGKDSHSSTTSIKMSGNEISYTKSSSGYRAGKTETKTCVFSDEQVSNIQNFLMDNNLNKDDSLGDLSSKYKSFEVFCNLSINVVMWENISKIRISGDTENFKSEPLYKNCLKLIYLIEGYLKKC